jgi:hypothetical protein
MILKIIIISGMTHAKMTFSRMTLGRMTLAEGYPTEKYSHNDDQ